MKTAYVYFKDRGVEEVNNILFYELDHGVILFTLKCGTLIAYKNFHSFVIEDQDEQ